MDRGDCSWHLWQPLFRSAGDLGLSHFWHTLRVEYERLLDGWEAVPLAAPLSGAEEAKRIERPWAPVRVPGHWQLEGAFAAYEGLVLYRCRFEARTPSEGEMLSLSFGGVYYSARVWLASPAS